MYVVCVYIEKNLPIYIIMYTQKVAACDIILYKNTRVYKRMKRVL